LFRTNTLVMNRIFIVMVSFLLASCATSGPIDSGKGIYHTVDKGQNLWRISQSYRIDIERLMKVNRIVDASKIEVGQKIFIPGAEQFINVEPAPRWTHIVIHHSATFKGNADIFDKQHRKRGFWNGLGYHFVIGNGSSRRRDGQLEIGHRWVKQMDGAHCNAMNMNKVGIGICLVGNFDEQIPSSSQLSALSTLVSQLQRQFNIASENIIKHNQVVGKNTDCPGHQFPWQQFKNGVQSPALNSAVVPSK